MWIESKWGIRISNTIITSINNHSYQDTTTTTTCQKMLTHLKMIIRAMITQCTIMCHHLKEKIMSNRLIIMWGRTIINQKTITILRLHINQVQIVSIYSTSTLAIALTILITIAMRMWIQKKLITHPATSPKISTAYTNLCLPPQLQTHSP